MSQSLVLMHTGKRGKWIMYQWSLTQAKSCWRSYWTDWSHRQRRSSLKTRQASEQAGTSQSRSSTYESSVRNIASTSKTSTMSSQTSRRPSTGFGMQLCGQPWRSTTSVPTLFKSSLWQGHQSSPLQRQHRRFVSNISWSPAGNFLKLHTLKESV